MDNPVLIILILAIVVLFVWQFYFSQEAEVKRKLKKTRIKNFEGINDGDIVKVKGKVSLQKHSMIAPLSGRKAAFYHIIVTEHNKGKNNYSEQIINHLEKRPLILINDETYIYVRTELINHYLIMDKNYSSGTFNDAEPNLEKFLRKFDERSTGLLGFNRSLSYEEGILEEGEEVVVVGKARWGDAKKLGLTTKDNKVLIIEAESSGTVTLSDDPETT